MYHGFNRFSTQWLSYGYVFLVLAHGLLLWVNSVNIKKVFRVQKKCVFIYFLKFQLALSGLGSIPVRYHSKHIKVCYIHTIAIVVCVRLFELIDFKHLNVANQHPIRAGDGVLGLTFSTSVSSSTGSQ